MSKFQPGRSGNPRGRPKGSGTSPATVLRRSIEGFAPELIQVLRKAAADGDVQAAASLLDRALPRLRSAPVAVAVDLAGPRSEVVDRILGEVAAGGLDPQSAKELMALADATSPEPEYQPIDTAKLDKLYADAMQHAESERLRMRERRAEIEREWEGR